MQLLARHEPVIRGYLRSLVSRAADVDELMPDVALVAWRKFSELREPEAFPRWACVIARYEALRFHRDRARDRLVLDEAVIAKLADDAGITKTQANATIDSFVSAVTKTLKGGGKVTLVGFGTFSVTKRAARNGRNPQTGAVIKIKAKKVAKFKAGKELSSKI